jgi:hypothetical protein
MGRQARHVDRSPHEEETIKRRDEGQQGYRKGDNHAGGGGSQGGGGKRRRPHDGWEKGDAARQVDDHHTAHPVPIKPGRDPDRKAEMKDERREILERVYHPRGRPE